MLIATWHGQHRTLAYFLSTSSYCHNIVRKATTTARRVRKDGAVVTRKAYDDLPTSLETVGDPLRPIIQEWRGGLEKSTLANSGIVTHSERLGDSDDLPIVPRKIRKTRKPATDIETNDGSSIELDREEPSDIQRDTETTESSAMAARRTRKKRVPNALDKPLNEAMTEAPLESQGEELAATKSPRKPRKKRASTTTDNSNEAPKGMNLEAQDPESVSSIPSVRSRKKRVSTAAADFATKPKEDVSEESVSEELATTTPPKKNTKRRRTDSLDQPTSEVSEMPRTQLAVEIQQNLARYPDSILLTRVGQFYESYFAQAADVAKLLNIKLTTRSWSGQRILMCGFPLMHLDRHLKSLIQTHKKSVAMCEEFPRPDGEGFDRRVTRILTPGTLLDESFINHYANNYLMAVSVPENSISVGDENVEVGLAWIDVSTGEFYSQSVPASIFHDEVVRIAPVEIVLPEWLQEKGKHPVRTAVDEEGIHLSYAPRSESPDIDKNIASPSDILLPQTTTSDRDIAENQSIDLLAAYLRLRLMEHMPNLLQPSRVGAEKRMHIDGHTLKSLEIVENLQESGTSGTLLSSLKKTVTSSGTRLLSRWLVSPSTSLDEINARQSLVTLFHRSSHLRNDVVEILKRMKDTSRVVQRFSASRGDVDDLLSLKDCILQWGSLQQRLKLECGLEKGISVDEERIAQWDNLLKLLSRMQDLSALADRIDAAVEEKLRAPGEAARSQRGDLEPEEQLTLPGDRDNTSLQWTIRPQFSDELTGLHEKLQDLTSMRSQLEALMQKRYDAPSLTLRSTGPHGLHVHVRKLKRDTAKLDDSNLFVPLSQSASTKSYFNKQWFQLGGQLSDTISRILYAEREAFIALRSEVIGHANSIRRNGRIVDEFDVVCSFASLAIERHFCKPDVNDSLETHIINGRHPTVELGLLSAGRMFTPNTVSLTPEFRLHIITGPNMGGKSTVLRQTALITIMAQTGSFVPVQSASMGLVDKVFSRVGAKDDLFHDRSTFMVEMSETAEILKSATPQSLVIMDEVGRGTTVKDGVAIAFATIHHLYFVNRCRGLFATHFHELVDMVGFSEDWTTSTDENPYANIGFFFTDVDETEKNRIAYSHRLQAGVNRDSHGILVARLAGMPIEAISTATRALKEIRAQDYGLPAQGNLQQLGRQLAHNTCNG